jgi:hypothetical protein
MEWHFAFGHRAQKGKPVKKVRFIPAERAHALARKLQGRFGSTVSAL